MKSITWQIGHANREHRIASYNKGCRCDQCRDAARLARAHQRAKVRRSAMRVVR